MSANRTYHFFTYKEAVFRISCDALDAVKDEIVRQRHALEAYIAQVPLFQSALGPLDVDPDAPAVARRMAGAAARVGVGPMAAVAGTMAQLAAEAGLAAGAPEAIVENGGDIYLAGPRPVTVVLYAGAAAVGGQLAFAVAPGDLPLAICSSSGKMGHSMSLGTCDLATVVSRSAAIADAAATFAANQVGAEENIDAALHATLAIDGVLGVLIAQGERIGLAGSLPRLERVRSGGKG